MSNIHFNRTDSLICFIQVMFSFVRLYSDNVLGIETCGLPDELLTEILGDRVQRHLRTLRDSGHLQGCRYNPFARQCCNTRDSTGKSNIAHLDLSPLTKGSYQLLANNGS